MSPFLLCHFRVRLGDSENNVLRINILGNLSNCNFKMLLLHNNPAKVASGILLKGISIVIRDLYLIATSSLSSCTTVSGRKVKKQCKNKQLKERTQHREAKSRGYSEAKSKD